MVVVGMLGRPRDCSNAVEASKPSAEHSFLFDVHVGRAQAAQRHHHITAQQHCCEVCRGIAGCERWQLRVGSIKGSVATCMLYGLASASRLPAVGARAPASAAEPPVVLLRSDTEKLQSLTRCHVELVRWLQSQLAGEADLELLVDASALPSGESLARVRTQLREALHVPSFLYTVEELERSFPAVRHWPSPESHDTSRNRLKGDSIKLWWTSVLKRHRKALGPRVARRLTSYLIHEPSLVLWARDRMRGAPASAGGLSERRESGLLPSYVWVVEDDAVFMGDMRGLMRLFHSPPPAAVAAAPAGPTPPTGEATAGGGVVVQDADLVSTFANLEGAWIEASSHDWKVNAAFARAFGDRRVHKWEHVERFSRRLIKRLDDLLTTEGAAAHGEMFASTVCLATPWCVASDLRTAGVVAPDASLYGPSASALAASERWERLELFERHRALGAPGVWLHSVKNVCNALALWSNGTVRISADDPKTPFVVALLGRDSPQPESPPSTEGAEPTSTTTCSEPSAADRKAAQCDQEAELVDPLAEMPLEDQEAGMLSP